MRRQSEGKLYLGAIGVILALAVFFTFAGGGPSGGEEPPAGESATSTTNEARELAREWLTDYYAVTSSAAEWLEALRPLTGSALAGEMEEVIGGAVDWRTAESWLSTAKALLDAGAAPDVTLTWQGATKRGSCVEATVLSATTYADPETGEDYMLSQTFILRLAEEAGALKVTDVEMSY